MWWSAVHAGLPAVWLSDRAGRNKNATSATAQQQTVCRYRVVVCRWHLPKLNFLKCWSIGINDLDRVIYENKGLRYQNIQNKRLSGQGTGYRGSKNLIRHPQSQNGKMVELKSTGNFFREIYKVLSSFVHHLARRRLSGAPIESGDATKWAAPPKKL
jgi:hypothetical protein